MLNSTDISYSSTCYNTFFNSRTGCMKGIVHTVFLFFHFYFCSCAYLQYSNSTCQLGKAFL